MRKFLFSLGVLLWAGCGFLPVVQADTAKVPVEVFSRESCGHCREEREFLLELSLRRDDFTVRFHDIDESVHRAHWLTLTELEDLPKVTPITLVGNTIIQGFDSAQTTGARIEGLIDQSVGQDTMNFEEFIAAGGSASIESVGGTCQLDSTESDCGTDPLLLTVPFFGVVNLESYSLPVLSLSLGLVDGFNPCAMWVLITFLVVLLNSGSRRRMWEIAGIFILSEALMYYLILNVWLTTWDFVGLDNLITPLVGLLAIGGGVFFLWEWRTNSGTCHITNPEGRSRTVKKIHALAAAEMTLAVALSIIGLALSVNIIEFACSVGIPQAFTKILDLNFLGFWPKQFYMLLYTLAYMFDDLVVFGIALYSFEQLGLTSKYTRLSHLIGGLLMLILGAILILEPTWLVF